MNINKKFAIEAAVAVAVIAAAAFAVITYRQGAGPQAAMPDPNVMAPVGSVTAVSADSISIRQQDGAKKTFAVSPATLVISQVSSGQTGKGLSDIAAGDMVIVRPSAADPKAAASIQISAMLGAAGGAPGAEAQAPSGPPVSFMGSVASVASSVLVIKPEDPAAANVQVTVTQDTVIRSNVLAGQKGKTIDDIAAGSPVFVAGTTGASGVVASSIQVLVPIFEQAR